MKYKLGDLVLFKAKHITENCIIGTIMNIDNSESTYYKYLVKFDRGDGKIVNLWLGDYDIELDKNYLRDIKINELLNGD